MHASCGTLIVSNRRLVCHQGFLWPLLMLFAGFLLCLFILPTFVCCCASQWTTLSLHQKTMSCHPLSVHAFLCHNLASLFLSLVDLFTAVLTLLSGNCWLLASYLLLGAPPTIKTCEIRVPSVTEYVCDHFIAAWLIVPPSSRFPFL